MGVEGRVKKRGKVQAHQGANQLAGKLKGAEHQPNGKAYGQPHTHLLQHHPKQLGTVQAYHGHVGQRGLD